MDYHCKYLKYKAKYLNLKTSMQTGGGIQQQNTDSGAGVILLEMYSKLLPNGQRDTPKLAIILFKNARNNQYADGGGNRDNINGKPEDLRDTARRELKEESANLFRLAQGSLSDNNAVRHSWNTQHYVGYFVGVQSPIVGGHYFTNLKTLETNKVDSHWLETNGLTRVYMDQFIADLAKRPGGDLSTIDTQGNQITIMGRTKALIREAMNPNIIQRINFIQLKFNPNYINSNSPQINGTKSYWT